MGKKLTQDEFINRSKNIHLSIYDYNKVKYINNCTKVCITCKKHGDFWQIPLSHLSKNGCPKCGFLKRGELLKRYALDKRKGLLNIPDNAIPLGTNGNYCIVSKEDYEYLSAYNWCLVNNGYAFNNQIGYMHRLLMNNPTEKEVDHKNRNRLDNRRENLRLCTRSENSKNKSQLKHSSKFKGVHWHKNNKKWRCQIRIDGKMTQVGMFDNEEEAAMAYDKFAKKYHGEFAYFNFNYI